MAAVAHRVGGVIDTHVTALDIKPIGGADGVEATRWFYRQRIEAVLSRETRPWFLLLDAGTHAAFAGEPARLKWSASRWSCRRCERM